MKRRWKLWGGLAVSGGALLLALLGIDLRRVAEALAQAEYIYLIPAAVAMLAYLVLRSVRWRLLLGPEVSLSRCFWITNVGYLVSNVLLSRLGDLARAVVIGRGGQISTAAALSTVVVERVLDMLMVLALLAGVTPFVSGVGWAVSVGWVAGGAALAASAGLLTLAFRPDWGRRATRWVLEQTPRLDEERWGRVFDDLLEGLAPLRAGGGRRGLALLAWSAMTWACSVAFYWAMLRAFLPRPPALAAPFLVCVLGLGMALPSSPGAVGVFHAVARYGLTAPFGVPDEQAVTIAFAVHAFQYVLLCLLGLVGLGRESLSLGTVQRGLRHAGLDAGPGYECQCQGERMTKRYLITGGAGFIGCNYVHRLLARGEQVTVYDNLSRRGTEANVEWLREQHGADSFRLVVGDVRDYETLASATRDADVVAHLAGQTAVTTSVTDPRSDFENNALGTFNALEAARHAGAHPRSGGGLYGTPPIFLYASTNKVYGGMDDVAVVEEETRYAYRDLPLGVSEAQPLDFHSPYGCSKGTGDQYVRDYARIYGMPTVVFRQSCIYGPRQMGVEDQGWVAWFIIAVLTGQPITIYGDGKQVRDVLFVDDLLNAYDAAIAHIDVTAGQIYNVGGGSAHTMSVWTEFGPILERLMGRSIPVSYAGWRPGDQRVVICDIRKAGRELAWQPRVGVEDGIRRLYEWVVANRRLFE